MKTSIAFALIAAVGLIAVAGIALTSGLGVAGSAAPASHGGAYGGRSGVMGGGYMGGGMMGGHGDSSSGSYGQWNCPMYYPNGGNNNSNGYCPCW